MEKMLIPIDKLSIEEILKIFFISKNYPLPIYIGETKIKASFDHICNAFLYSPSIILWAYGENFFQTIPLKSEGKTTISLNVETFSRLLYNAYDITKFPPDTNLIILDNLNIYSREGFLWYPTILLMEEGKMEFQKVTEVGMKWSTLFKFLKTFYSTRENFSIYKNTPNPYFNFYLYLRSLYAEYNKIPSVELEQRLLNTPKLKKEEKDRILDELTRRKVLSTHL